MILSTNPLGLSSHRPAHGPKRGRVLCIVTRTGGVLHDIMEMHGRDVVICCQEGRSNSTEVPNHYLISGWPSKNRGILPPKWMVKIMENPIKMDDLEVPLFLETPIYVCENTPEL